MIATIHSNLFIFYFFCFLATKATLVLARFLLRPRKAYAIQRYENGASFKNTLAERYRNVKNRTEHAIRSPCRKCTATTTFKGTANTSLAMHILAAAIDRNAVCSPARYYIRPIGFLVSTIRVCTHDVCLLNTRSIVDCCRPVGRLAGRNQPR